MEKVLAQIVTIGDEILFGHITDTNSQWLSNALSEAGFNVMWKNTIGDDEEEILQALSEGEKRASVIVTTGGLGPTKDDKTIQAFARYFNHELVTNEEVLENIRHLYFKSGKELNKLSYVQARIPAGATPLQNPLGTAPGLWMEKSNPVKVFVALPGVPSEMKRLMEDAVIPKLREIFETPVIRHKTVRTLGIPESDLAEILEEWEAALPAHLRLAYLPRVNQVRLRLTGTGHNAETLQHEMQAQLKQLRPLLGKHYYGEDGEDITEVVGKILKQKQLTIATAESCTGGLIANTITDIPGCSSWFQGGIVAYSNQVKSTQLSVKQETLDTYGAVSEQTAREMAENVRQRYRADIGISTTGIAGPGGAVPGKPVGTIYIGYANAEETVVKLLNVSEDRYTNIQYTRNAIMDLVRHKLKERF